MATPMVAPEPFSLTGRLAGTFAQLDQNNASRAESAAKYREAQMDNVRALAQALLTSSAAHNAFGGSQIAGMVGGEGMLGGDVFGTGSPTLPQGALSGAYTQNADSLRLAGMARRASGGGGRGGPKPPKLSGGQFWKNEDGSIVYGDSDMVYGLEDAGQGTFTPIMAPPAGSSVIDLESGRTATFGEGGGAPAPASGGDVQVGGSSGGSSVEADPDLDLARQMYPGYRVRRDESGNVVKKPGPELDYEGNAEWQPL